MSVNDYMLVTDDVRQAVFAGQAIVAVPSAFFMGEAVAQYDACRAAIERHNAKMALVAIWKGKLTVGLSTEQMHTLAAQPDVAQYASRSDFAPLCARRANAAAGVALTMLAAQRCGIDVVAGGAMEGVWQSENGGCCSPTLVELTQTTTLLIAAGWKNNVHRPQTMACLEMQDIPVALWQTDCVDEQTHAALHRLDTPEQAGVMFRAHRDVCRKGGVLLMAQTQADEQQARLKSCEVAAQVAGCMLPTPFSE